jgi:hypothetical protein
MMFRQGVHDNMRMQMSTQDTHTNMICQQQQLMDQAGQQLEDIQETADANAELLARISLVGDEESSSFGEKHGYNCLDFETFFDLDILVGAIS